MAQKPGYITGANAKIKVANVTLAYATDVSYNVTVQTIPIESMGKYEVHANEPVGYTVDGSFSIIRYTKQAKVLAQGDADARGNSPASMAKADTSLKEHLDPGLILTSETFDIDLYQKHGTAAAGAGVGDVVDQSVIRVSDCRITRRGGTLNKRGVLVENFAFVGVLLHDSDTDTAEQVSNSGVTDLT